MPQYFSKYALAVVFALSVFGALPLVADAHEAKLPYWGSDAPILSCVGSPDASGAIAEQCDDFCDILHTIQHVIYFVLTIAIFVLVPLMVLAGGAMILVSGASPSLRETGKKTLTGAIVGAVLALGSFLIVSTILWVLGNPAPSEGRPRVSWPNIECSIKP